MIQKYETQTTLYEICFIALIVWSSRTCSTSAHPRLLPLRAGINRGAQQIPSFLVNGPPGIPNSRPDVKNIPLGTPLNLISVPTNLPTILNSPQRLKIPSTPVPLAQGQAKVTNYRAVSDRFPSSFVNSTAQQPSIVADSHATQLPTVIAPTKTKQPESKVENTTNGKFTREQLESALKVDGIKCGTVPMYEKLYQRSINESYNTNSDDTGDFRILHGLDTKKGEWPWIARISRCEGENCFTCTGTLLNSQWLITAGHCGNTATKTHYNYKATLGLYDLVAPDKTSFSVPIDKLIVHPDYKDLNNDLMLIRLAKPVAFGDFVQPACLIHATRNVLDYTRNKKCYTVGYGVTDGMVEATSLQKLEITTKQPNACNGEQLGYVKLRRNTVCVGPPENKIGGSCKGDSGGPDLCYDPKRGSWVLFGTVSYGPSDCDREKGDKWLTVSVDVSNYRTWILTTILQNS